MQCISPTSIARPNGLGSRDRILVPCAKCYACLSNQRSDWSFRLKQELKVATTAKFVTLTYEEAYLPKSEKGIPELRKRDVQLFIKRLRKDNQKNIVAYAKSKKVQYKQLNAPSIRYFAVGEYGTKTKRPHYHMILFNATYKSLANLDKIWYLGLVHIGDVNEASIHYTTKYMLTKHSESKDVEKPFSLMSRRPAIGSNYLKNQKYHKENGHFHVMNNGYKQRLPRYYKEKLFTKLEKDLYTVKMKGKIDEIEKERHKEFERKGLNPLLYEQELKEDKRRSINKQITKGEKL